MATSFEFAQFIVGRIVLGIGTGGIIATVSVWQAETAKANSRGEHVSSFGIFCALGLILCLWLEFGCSYISSSAAWRFSLAVPILLSGIVMTFIFNLPESPRLVQLPATQNQSVLSLSSEGSIKLTSSKMASQDRKSRRSSRDYGNDL